jgi:hypothetical protein
MELPTISQKQSQAGGNPTDDFAWVVLAARREINDQEPVNDQEPGSFDPPGSCDKSISGRSTAAK